MAKSKPEVTTEFTSSKAGKLRDPQATMKLSLGVAFAHTTRKAAEDHAAAIRQFNSALIKNERK